MDRFILARVIPQAHQKSFQLFTILIKFFSNLSRTASIRNLVRSESGHVGVMFGMFLIPIVSAVGMSVDYSSAINAKSKIQSALDSAALAAGRMLQTTGSTAEAQAAAQKHFDASIDSSINAVLSIDSINGQDGKINLTGTADVPTQFMAIVGVNSIKVVSKTQAELALGGKSQKDIELSLMLDVTGSMQGSKLSDLKLAAKDLIQIIMQGNVSSPLKARIAVVPFSESVNVSRYAQEVANAASATTKFKDNKGKNKTWKVAKDCVSERTGPEAFTDARPNGQNKIGTLYTEDGSCQPENELVPLTDDKSELETLINSLSATGYTAGHLGTAWAWYVLSPEWRTVWPPKSRPETDKEKAQKYAVLMTDGEYNTEYYNGVMTRYQQNGSSSPNGSSDYQANQICNNMKAAGITVYTIGFELDSSTARKTMKNCASTEDHYFLAENGDKLREAFREIAFQIAQLRISR